MALSKSSLMIRDYENIRQLLRDIYIYGCFSRDDYIEKNGISGRKYDKEQQRISAYLPEKFIRKRRVNKKVLMYCTYSTFDGAENYLAETYRNKSFTALDIMSFFFVQQMLSNDEEMTAAEILEGLPYVNENALFTKDNLRVKLEELVSKGFICSRKENRKVLFSLSKDIWKDFDTDELQDILTYLKFLKNVSPIEMPYYFLHEKLKLYLIAERKAQIDDTGMFQFKHNHLFSSLDNDVLLKILKAKSGGHTLVISLYGKQQNSEIEVLPVEVIHDSLYGRQYLYGVSLKDNLSKVIRLDRMASVQLGRNLTPDERRQQECLSKYSDECWCTSDAGCGLTEVVIEFRFDEDKEKFILRRIKEEGHGGLIERKAPGFYEYRIQVRDPDEMIPWIRSFGERAKIIASGQRKTEIKIAQDWKRAVEKYESL